MDAPAALPAASAATGIAGHVRHEGAAYVHTAGPVAQYAVGAPAPAAGFYLESANARLTGWDSANGVQQLRFEGHLALHATFMAPGCELQGAAGLKATRRGDRLDVEATSLGPTLVVLRCAG